MLTIQDIILEPPAPEQEADPLAWFDTPGPVELEIGCGKGGFLLHRARAHPELRLVGIEWANKYFRYCADRMARWGLTNVRVMRTDAGPFVMRHLPPACLSALHLYHPDPWPKKRHHKRRLVQGPFVEAVARVLRPAGHWYIQTDHEDYFTQMTALLDPHEMFCRVDAHTPACDPPPEEETECPEGVVAQAAAADPCLGAAAESSIPQHALRRPPAWTGTNFEAKYRREGRTIYRAVYQRRP